MAKQKKNIIIMTDVADYDSSNELKTILLKRIISAKTYRYLKVLARARNVPIQSLFATIIEKAREEKKMGYLSFLFMQKTLKIAKIYRFIENYPDQLAVEFRNLLCEFLNKKRTRRQVKKMMAEKIAIALNTIRPIRRRNKKENKNLFPVDNWDGG
jgi:quinol monooxygenase YgiN